MVTWDSPIPSADGEQLFIAQVDFNETGMVMADMALSIIGPGGGEFAVLSATPDAANQNAWNASMKEHLKDPKYSKIKLVDLVYGDDQSEKSYNQALALVDKYPNLKLIMAPTTVGIAAAAKAMQDEGLCDQVKVSGLGLPAEMVSYTLNGCAPEFALWSFVDLGYLSYYATYMMATGQIEGVAGETFKAGRMGYYTIEKDPTRDKGLRVKMGPFLLPGTSRVRHASRPHSIPATSGGEMSLRADAVSLELVSIRFMTGRRCLKFSGRCGSRFKGECGILPASVGPELPGLGLPPSSRAETARGAHLRRGTDARVTQHGGSEVRASRARGCKIPPRESQRFPVARRRLTGIQ